MKNANIIMLVSMDYVSFVIRMSSYQEESLKRILRDVKVRCIKCHSKMIRVVDLYDDAIVGYSCEYCPHYNLLNHNVI
mgnify:CR=1 FL=1